MPAVGGSDTTILLVAFKGTLATRVLGGAERSLCYRTRMYGNRAAPLGFVRRGLASLLLPLGLVVMPGCGPVDCDGDACSVSVSIEITLESWSVAGSYLIEIVEPGGVAVSCTVEVDAESSTESCTNNYWLRHDTAFTRVIRLNGRPALLQVRVLRNGAVLVEHEGQVPYSPSGTAGCGETCESGKVVVAE